MLHKQPRSAKTSKNHQDLELQASILCTISRKMHFYNSSRCNTTSQHSSPCRKSTCSKECFTAAASPRSSTQPWWTAPKPYPQSSRSSWTDCKSDWWGNSINNHSWLCFRTKSSSSLGSIIKCPSDFRVFLLNSTQGCSLRLIKIRLLPRISCNCSRLPPTDRNQLNQEHLEANSTLISNSSKWINKLIWCKIWLAGNRTWTEPQPAKHQTSLLQQLRTHITTTINKPWPNSKTTLEKPKKSWSKKKKKFAASESKWRTLTSASSKDTRAFCSKKATIKSWSSCKRQSTIQSKSKRLLTCVSSMIYQRTKESKLGMNNQIRSSSKELTLGDWNSESNVDYKRKRRYNCKLISSNVRCIYARPSILLRGLWLSIITKITRSWLSLGLSLRRAKHWGNRRRQRKLRRRRTKSDLHLSRSQRTTRALILIVRMVNMQILLQTRDHMISSLQRMMTSILDLKICKN